MERFLLKHVWIAPSDGPIEIWFKLALAACRFWLRVQVPAAFLWALGRFPVQSVTGRPLVELGDRICWWPWHVLTWLSHIQFGGHGLLWWPIVIVVWLGLLVTMPLLLWRICYWIWQCFEWIAPTRYTRE